MVGPRDFQLASSEQMTAGGPDPEGSPPEPESAKVFYTRAPLVLPQEWSGMRCGSLRLLTVTGQEEFTLCYPDAQGWTLFFQFPRPGESILLETSPLAEGERRPSAQAVPAALPGTAAEPPPWACSFAESFVRRFQILLGFVDASREPPFPAILQLGR